MKQITWMHPSYRDLVIEELGRDRSLRRIFLKTAGTDGLQLAFSDVGGSDGKRFLPLLIDDESWVLVKKRCIELVDQANSWEISSLMQSLYYVAHSSASSKINQRVLGIIRMVCNKLLSKWNGKKSPLSIWELRIYCNSTVLLTPLLPVPDITSTWEHYSNSAKESLSVSNVENWVDLILLVSQNEPRFLKQVKFPENHLPFIEEIISKFENDLMDDIEDWPIDELEDNADRFSRAAESMHTLAALVEPLEQELDDLASLFGEKEDVIRDRVREIHKNEPEEELEIIKPMLIEEFDIQTLFSDL